MLRKLRRASRAVARHGLLGDSARRRVESLEAKQQSTLQPVTDSKPETSQPTPPAEVKPAAVTEPPQPSHAAIDRDGEIESKQLHNSQVAEKIDAAKERLKREHPPLGDEE